MKRIIAALLGACLVSLSLAACGKSDVPAGMKDAAAAADARYHLYVPDNWIVDRKTGAVNAYYASDDRTSVNVMAWKAPNSEYTPAMWWNSSQTGVASTYADFELVAATETALDGVPAMQYEWTGKLGGEGHRYLQVAAVRQDTVYVVTYGALVFSPNEKGDNTLATDRFADHLEDMKQILAEFRFA